MAAGADVQPSLIRNQAEARRVLNENYPFKCCAVCGLQLATCLTVAHLDHDASNNAPDNLARLCQTHHWMYDAGLYPIEAIIPASRSLHGPGQPGVAGERAEAAGLGGERIPGGAGGVHDRPVA